MKKSFLPKSVYNGLLIAFGLIIGANGMVRSHFKVKEFLVLMIFDLLLLNRAFKNIYGHRFVWPDVVTAIGIAVVAIGAVSLSHGAEAISWACMVVMGAVSFVPAVASLVQRCRRHRGSQSPSAASGGSHQEI